MSKIKVVSKARVEMVKDDGSRYLNTLSVSIDSSLKDSIWIGVAGRSIFIDKTEAVLLSECLSQFIDNGYFKETEV